MVLVLALGAPAKAAPVPTDSGEAWDWPLSPTPDVVTGFHPPITPYGPGHVGVDLLGWPGQPVTAVADGTVHFAGQVAGTQVVSVMHGAERSTYQPVVAVVGRGDVVAAGQLIGTLSTDGGHCLPLACLHLGRRAGDIYLDPLALVGGGPVRLLPLDGAPAPPMPPGFETPVWETLHQGVSLGLW
jgi:murein DD-endopeptidase MepM/ murein hydrolase activator NlpD